MGRLRRRGRGFVGAGKAVSRRAGWLTGCNPRVPSGAAAPEAPLSAPDPASDPLAALLAPWDYLLPDAQIARTPAPRREDARLLVLGEEGIEHRAVPAVVELARPGDVWVLNDVRVHHARLRARRGSGGAVEVLLVAPLPDEVGPSPRRWRAMARPGRRLHEGERIPCGEGEVELLRRHADGSWDVATLPDVDTLTRTGGELPLPPYLDRAPDAEDEHRYQTVYARAGALRAAAAPTAGLHLTEALLEALRARGVRLAPVTLEVGAGTFRPLGAEQLSRGELHRERFVVPEASWAAVTEARASGGRVVAVGTTSARVLESALGPGEGATTLFIRPGHDFRVVDVLLTNFHLPRSSLLMLVCAFGGQERVMDAYRAAVAAGYRFFSYGDAMWVPRAPG